MACLPDGRSRRKGFPLLGQHKQAGFYAEFENNHLVEPGPDLAVATDGGQEAQADAELVEVLAPGLGQGGLLPLELVPRDHAEGRYAGIADILCQRFSPSLMRCAPTGWCPWSCSCRRAAA